MTVTELTAAAVGTLANGTGLLIAGPGMTRGGRLLSVRGAVSIRNLAAGDGPFLYGLAEKALSLAELEEYLEIGGPKQPEEVPQKEKSSRGSMVRTIGLIQPAGDGTTASLYLDNKSLSGMKFNEEDGGWNYWIYNLGPTATTGATWQNSVQFFTEFNPSG